jgi:protein involved in polysaccharide export with SLBB domain
LIRSISRKIQLVGKNAPDLSALVFCGLLILLVAASALAQSIKLTPEQQAMLDQLPPAQRQQAMEAIRQFERQNAKEGSDSDETQELDLPQTSIETPLPDIPLFEEEPKAEGGSRLVITLTPREDLGGRELRELESDPALEQVTGSNYYELDEAGVLVLPGLPTIPLLGLTEDSIGERLTAEPALKVFDVEVSLLDVKSAAAGALEPFGYSVFEAQAAGFEPVTTGPVPPDYVLGPGDSVRVQLFGNVNGIYEFEVSRDGILNLPELGPVTVAGLPFSEFRRDLNQRVEKMLIGTQVSVTMGQLRTMRIFVLGDVNRPGSFVVSSLATISSSLYYSGGISEIGSLRNIQLKRNGQTVATDCRAA